ncbi:MAG TPA: phosphate uptake regulator PhoU [Conexivisphaerales archaeon]|nr:phosphate uptake regulator PhoU [Conexivisphaerales archaeon]
MDPEEEIRKVQFTGRASYIINLPKRWIVKQKIQQGDPLVVLPQPDGSLRISPKALSAGENAQEVVMKVAPDLDNDSLIRRLVSLYLSGYNTVRLVAAGGVTLVQREVIKQLIRTRFVGTEIVSESSDSMTLQVLMSLPELPVEDALRRMSIIAGFMLRDAFRAVETLDRNLATSVIKADDEVDRFSLYVIRQLVSAVRNQLVMKEIRLSNPVECLGYRVVVKSVERMADHASNIASTVLSMEKKLDAPTLSDLAEFKSMDSQALEDSLAALFKRDYSMADGVFEVVSRCRKLDAKVLARISERKGIDETASRLIAEDLRRWAEYSADIAEVVLNLTVAPSQA